MYVGCSSGSEPPHFFWYNRTTDRWTTLAAPHTDHHHGEGGAVAGKFYLVGTRSGIITEDLLEVYNPATNTWTVKAPMPFPRSWSAGAAAGGMVFVLGGLNENEKVLNSVIAYTP